jgi:hypothetical protein
MCRVGKLFAHDLAANSFLAPSRRFHLAPDAVGTRWPL